MARTNVITECLWCGETHSYAIIRGAGMNQTQPVQCPDCRKHMFINMTIRKAIETPDYHDPTWLHEEYHGKGRTMADIAADFGVTPMTINIWLNKLDIPTRSRGHKKNN